MPEDNVALDEIFRMDFEELDSDFSTTKSFTEAVAKAKREIAKSFEAAMAAAEKDRASVKVKEPEPA